MRRSSTVGICVIAAFVFSAMMSAAASAEPEFVTKAVVGEAVNKVPFTGTIGPTFFEGQKSRSKISCSNLSGAGSGITGEVNGPKSLANIVITFTGCGAGECQANTQGKPAGVIESKVLAGTLGAVTPTVPGIKLYSQAEGKGGTAIEADCGAGIVHIVWKGEVTGALGGSAGEDAATGKLLSTMKLTFAEAVGKQKYKGFSEGPESELLGQLETVINGSPELTGWSSVLSTKTVPSTWGLGVTK
jgi:hypothetical protein